MYKNILHLTLRCMKAAFNIVAEKYRLKEKHIFFNQFYCAL